jgi:hypothetical protein
MTEDAAVSKVDEQGGDAPLATEGLPSRRRLAGTRALVVGAAQLDVGRLFLHALCLAESSVVPQGDQKPFPLSLSIHAIAGSIALLVGPWQLSTSLRTAHPRVH